MRSATCILLAAGLGLQCVVSSGFQFQHGRRQMPSTTTQNQPLSPVTGVGNSPESEIPDSVERKRLAMYSRERQAQAMSDARQLAERSRELEAFRTMSAFFFVYSVKTDFSLGWIGHWLQSIMTAASNSLLRLLKTMLLSSSKE